MSVEIFERVHPHLEAWLERCEHVMPVARVADYEMWYFVRDGITGSIELIDDPELTQSHDIFSLAVELNLEEPQSVQDLRDLLFASEWLSGSALVWKSLDGDAGHYYVQLKDDLSRIDSPEVITTLFRRAVEGKEYFEGD